MRGRRGQLAPGHAEGTERRLTEGWAHGGRCLRRAGGAPPGRDGADAEHVGDRAEDAAGRWGQGEKLGDSGLGEQAVQLRGVGGGLGTEGADQPAAAAGERGADRVREAATGPTGPRPAAGGRAPIAPARWGPGGEASHQALAAAGGAVEAVPERHDEGDETRLAQEAAGDEGGEGGEDEAEPTGEVGGEGGERGREGRCLHENIPSTKPGPGQEQ